MKSAAVLIHSLVPAIARIAGEESYILQDSLHSWWNSAIRIADGMLGIFLPESARAELLLRHYAENFSGAFFCLSLSTESEIVSSVGAALEGNAPFVGWFSAVGAVAVLVLLGVMYRQRRRFWRELEAREARCRAFLDNAPVALMLWDAEGRFQFANSAFWSMFGPKADEAWGAAPEKLLAEDSVATYRSFRARLENEGQAEACLSCNTASGAFYLEVNGTRLPDGGFIAFGRDVTGYRETEMRLRESKEVVVAASRAKDVLLAKVSHEIRTPLNGVLGMLEVLQGSSLDGHQRECVDMAYSAGRILQRLIEDILDFSRGENGKLALVPEPTDVQGILEEIRVFFGQMAAKKGIDLRVCAAGSIPGQVMLDSARFWQLLSNLVGNAVKFTREGEVAVHVSYLERAGKLLVSVEDTGPGIPDERLEAVFDAFVQADSSLPQGECGIGLGLSIVRNLVSLMGGSLSVESTPGQGTAFCFTVSAEPARDSDLESPAGEDAVLQAPAVGKKVLIVEDNPVNRLVAARFLESLGYVPLCAEDGERALQMLAAEEFAAVLMDVQMAGIDGVATTARIRGGDYPGIEKDIPIIAMTAHALQENAERFRKAGMDGYVPKPIAKAKLAAELERLVGML